MIDIKQALKTEYSLNDFHVSREGKHPSLLKDNAKILEGSHLIVTPGGCHD
jgi:hypothetical protein